MVGSRLHHRTGVLIPVPTLSNHVGDIVLLRTEPQVFIFTAGSVIAGMQDLLAIRDGTMKKFPSYVVGLSPLKPTVTLLILASSPQVAWTSLIHLGPKLTSLALGSDATSHRYLNVAGYAVAHGLNSLKV